MKKRTGMKNRKGVVFLLSFFLTGLWFALVYQRLPFIYDINDDVADCTYFMCTDKNGVSMRIRLYHDIYKNCNGLTHLYVDYDNYTWGYLIEITKR